MNNKCYYTINWVHMKPVPSVTQEVSSDGRLTADVFREDHFIAPKSPASLSVMYQSTFPTLSERPCHLSLSFFKEPPHRTPLNSALLLRIYFLFHFTVSTLYLTIPISPFSPLLNLSWLISFSFRFCSAFHHEFSSKPSLSPKRTTQFIVTTRSSIKTL